MKVLGIGNAIVDVICKVDENFISDNNLSKVCWISLIGCFSSWDSFSNERFSLFKSWSLLLIWESSELRDANFACSSAYWSVLSIKFIRCCLAPSEALIKKSCVSLVSLTGSFSRSLSSLLRDSSLLTASSTGSFLESLVLIVLIGFRLGSKLLPWVYSLILAVIS